MDGDMLSGSLWSLALKQHAMLGLFISHRWDRLCTLIYARMKSYKMKLYRNGPQLVSYQLETLMLGQVTWWRHQMETFSALLAICAGNSPVPGEFPAQRPVTRGFDIFFDLRLNKRLSKQSWGWWFETQPGPLCHHSNEMVDFPTDRWSNTHQHLTENRLNGDKTVNTYGKKLIELTRSNNMVLLNGRMRSYSRSRNSQFTCYKYNGASAVDYVIADYDILNAVKQFDVKHKTPDSDHCPLTYILNNGYIQTNTQIEKFSSTLNLCKWDQKTADQYIESLQSTESRRYFDNFLCDTVDNRLNSNQVVQHFYQYLEDIIQKTFAKRCRKSTSTFPKNTWFDAECKEIKNALRAAVT